MTINSYVTECLAQFVTGAMDIDTEWDAYVRELQNNDLDIVIQVMQGAYDRTR